MKLGFDEQAAAKALAANNGDAKAAVHQLLQMKGPAIPANSSEQPEGKQAKGDERQLRKLMKLGFDEQSAVEALASNNGDAKAAVRQLLATEWRAKSQAQPKAALEPKALTDEPKPVLPPPQEDAKGPAEPEAKKHDNKEIAKKSKGKGQEG